MNVLHGSWNISRRTALKGLGTAIALPWLEAMLPRTARAAAGTLQTPPRRLAVFYVPNGLHMPAWTPTKEGVDFELPPTMEPFKDLRDDMLVLSGLTLDKARANGDGPGDHARALSAFLTCCQPRKTHGADISVGPSFDQVAARSLGRETKFPSLEIGCDAGAQNGNCDSGYSCAYSANIAWRTASTPVTKEVNPRAVFERLFVDPDQGGDAVARAKAQRERRSILDFVRDDAERLHKKLGTTDRHKLDQYLSAIHEIEARIQRAEHQFKLEDLPPHTRPTGIPRDYAEHIRLLGDMMVLAFQTDATRICTFVLANEGSNRSYKFIDVPEGHHDLSHHGNDEAKQAKIQKINQFHTTHVAYVLSRLKEIREGEGTLLDQCAIVYGSGIGDGNAHNHDDLPIAVFGKAGGLITPGRHLRFSRETPLANLYVSLLEGYGVDVDKHGDSTGELPGLKV